MCPVCKGTGWYRAHHRRPRFGSVFSPCYDQKCTYWNNWGKVNKTADQVQEKGK